MQKKLSSVAKAFTPSPIQELSLLAQRCNAINLAEGFPDFPAPPHIKNAAVSAINSDFNQYRLVSNTETSSNLTTIGFLNKSSYFSWFLLWVWFDFHRTVFLFFLNLKLVHIFFFSFTRIVPDHKEENRVELCPHYWIAREREREREGRCHLASFQIGISFYLKNCWTVAM